MIQLKYRIISTLLFFILLSGCSTKMFRQSGSDNFTVPFSLDKAVVIIEAKAEEHGTWAKNAGTMLVGFAQLIPGKSQDALYLSPEWEFATYPGALIPGYAGKDPHGIQAYLLKPGKYAAIRCIYQAPEADYCPEGYWQESGNSTGIAFFEAFAGDVINIGQLNVIRKRSRSGSSYAVSIVNNQNEAKIYIQNNWPSLVDKVIYKPFQFTY